MVFKILSRMFALGAVDDKTEVLSLGGTVSSI